MSLFLWTELLLFFPIFGSRFAHELNRGDAGEALCSAVSHTGPPGSPELSEEGI